MAQVVRSGLKSVSATEAWRERSSASLPGSARDSSLYSEGSLATSHRQPSEQLILPSVTGGVHVLQFHCRKNCFTCVKKASY